MKKWTALLSAVLLMTAANAMNRTDLPITVSELPAAAQEFLNTYFADREVAYVLYDDEVFDKDYKVRFTDGADVEFSRDGSWKDVSCKRSGVPEGIVPQPIAETVSSRFPGRTVIQIERDRRGYEVELDNRLELKFNTKFRLVEIDD